VQLVAVAFNHDASSATNDALSIRADGDEFVHVPEWQRGQTGPSLAAYSIADTTGRTITVLARFHAPELAGRAVEVRAMPTPPSPGLTAGLDPVTASVVEELWRYHAGVLGRVGAGEVELDGDGDSGFVELELVDPLFRFRGVGSFLVSWTWQFRTAGGRWTPFTTSFHRVYTLLAVPTEPWQQEPYDESNTQLPWASVLDWTCSWAAGTFDRIAAATAVTHGLFAQGGLTVTYGCQFGGPSAYATLAFDCTALLERLAGLPGRGVFVNCSDCATIVSTFANAVGCDLWQSQMFDELQAFAVNPARLIGTAAPGLVCGTGFFLYHEVAWTGACGVADRVYDACVEGLVSLGPLGPVVPILPTNMIFGLPNSGGYRDVLAAPLGRLSCRPHPEKRQRRFVF
jgi:hypothetical protein